MRDKMLDYQMEYLINPKKDLENKIHRNSTENLPPRPLAKDKAKNKVAGI